MEYVYKYSSPLGDIWLKSDGIWITELSLEENDKCIMHEKQEIFAKTIKWLDTYFKGEEPKENLPLKVTGTLFQKEVWNLLLEIPYGQLITYKELAEKIARKRKMKKMSSQAVGNAIHNNPIPIIIPCHRVVGKNLVGYGLGMDIKIKLLKLENTNLEGYYFYETKTKIKVEQ